VPVEVTDAMRPASLPHGWGHDREGVRLTPRATCRREHERRRATTISTRSTALASGGLCDPGSPGE
jgi:hypothetical protein